MQDLVDSFCCLVPVCFSTIYQEDAREIEGPALLNLVDFVLCIATHRQLLVTALKLLTKVKRSAQMTFDLAHIKEDI